MQKIKNSRSLSFIAVAVIYVIAAIVGLAVYKLIHLDIWLKLLIADAAATAATFIFSLIFKNASVYDPYWSVQPIFIVFAFAAGAKLTLARALVIAAIFYWGVRLTANWAYTFHGLKHQDWRYTMLNETTGVFYPIINFIGIHMVPTLIVYGCTLPAVYLMINDTAANAGTVVFFLVSAGAATLQLVSDVQMHRYRRHRTGSFIRTGLWKYSRHPNYLGEVLMWWGVALSLVCVMPEKWYLMAGAFANTVLFLSVSIPMADKRQSSKEGFEEYKKETRMLLPVKKLHTV